MRKSLLIVSGGIEAVPGIRLAKEMGLHVIVSDKNPKAPGFGFADDHIIASTYDVEETVSAARRYHTTVRPIDGVICIAADVPLTVASVADALGLPGIPIEAAKLATEKLAMKQRFLEKDIAIPWFSEVESLEHLRQVVSKRGLPLVLKPVDSRGARGVLKLNSDVDLRWAFYHAQEFSPTCRVMVEEYVAGLQISTESILLEGAGYTPGFIERNYEYLDRFAPNVIENGGQQPSALKRIDQEAVSMLAEKAGRAMGITTGIIKGDMVMTWEGPKVIEIAARLSGGWMSTDQIPLGTGVNLAGVAIRLALGEKIKSGELVPKYNRGVAIRYFFPEPGRVQEIKYADKFDGLPWVYRLGFFVKTDDILEPVINHTKRAGFVITTGDTRDEAVARASEVINTVKIITAPL